MTCSPEISVFGVGLFSGEGDGHEAQQVHGRTDHRRAEEISGRVERGEIVPKARDQRCDVLQLALKVWRAWRSVRRRAEATRGREQSAEEVTGGVDDECLGLARDARKKFLKPGAKRSAVSWAMTEKGYSQRRVCRLVVIDPRVHRYRHRPPCPPSTPC